MGEKKCNCSCKNEIDEILNKYKKGDKSQLIQILNEIQEKYGIENKS